MMDFMLGFCKGTDYLGKSWIRKRYKKKKKLPDFPVPAASSLWFWLNVQFSMVSLFIILSIHSSCAPLQVLLDSTEQTFYLSHNKTPLKRLIKLLVVCFLLPKKFVVILFFLPVDWSLFPIRFIVFMLYDTNVGLFIGIQAFIGRKMRKEPLFLTCIKRSGSFVIVMKYQTAKVSPEVWTVNLSVNLFC